MTEKLRTGASVVVPPVDLSVILKLPAATAVTIMSYKLEPVLWLTITVSVAATVEFVTVKDAAVVEPAADTKVMLPFVLLMVTPVVLDVTCVTAPPDPVL